MSVGGTDMFVAKLDAGGGAHIWSKGIGDALLQAAFSGAPVDADGSMTLGGRFVGEIDLGSGPVKAEGTGENYFAAKLDTAGAPVWVRAIATTTTKQTGAIGADSQGNVLLTSLVSGSVELGAQAVMTNGQDVLVVKMDAKTGDLVWGRVMGGPLGDTGRGIAADGNGDVIVTGEFEDKMDVGLKNGPLVSQGLEDMFIMKLAR